ncbi:MAG: TA system VapC family ribonuclease toxin [Tetrasphaera sp.]
MTRSLLDINVLIALVDPDHVDHQRVHVWGASGLQSGWASCAITENGFVRILSQPAYPGYVTVAQAAALLREARDGTDHEFWDCSVSIVDPEVIDTAHLLGHRQVTDAYLLALAVARDAELVTLDRSVSPAAVRGAGPQHLVVV